MQKINVGRVVLGGLLAGLIINVWETVLNGMILGSAWQARDNALSGVIQRPSPATGITIWICWAFIAGLAAVWMYAAIRPRFGAGPATGVRAGVAVWVVGWGMATLAQINFGVPTKLNLINLLVGLVGTPVATVAGAWLYKEGSQGVGVGVATGR